MYSSDKPDGWNRPLRFRDNECLFIAEFVQLPITFVSLKFTSDKTGEILNNVSLL